ncbi:hypothetical protein ACWEQN_25625 [Streptomyces sp. NPDC004129]
MSECVVDDEESDDDPESEFVSESDGDLAEELESPSPPSSPCPPSPPSP